MEQTSRIAEVYRRHVQHVYRLCYSFMHSAAEAEDATQQTFMRLIDYPQKFNDAHHERAWLLKVAANICRDTLKSARYTRVGEMPAHFEVADERGSADKIDTTLELVYSLPDTYKDLVFMYYYEDMPTKEIAECLELPHSTVRNRLSEARKLLRSVLEKENQHARA